MKKLLISLVVLIISISAVIFIGVYGGFTKDEVVQGLVYAILLPIMTFFLIPSDKQNKNTEKTIEKNENTNLIQEDKKVDKKNFLGYEKSVMEKSHKRSRYFVGIAIVFLSLSFLLGESDGLISFLWAIAIGIILIQFISLVIYKILVKFFPKKYFNRFDVFGVSFLFISFLILISSILG